MSLQYYDINLAPTATQKIGAQGRYIYYYAGTTPLISGGATPAAAGNQAIKVQAGQSGNSILLMPGQSYRLDDTDKAPTEWIVTNFKQAENITGQVLVGEGDFRDSNTSNTSYVKLDATFANNVKVTNDVGTAVPVAVTGLPLPVTISNSQVEITNDAGNRIPVTLDPAQSLNITGNIMAYTASYAGTGASVANTPIQLLAAQANGAVLNRFDVAMNAAAGLTMVVIAKATAPASVTDGDVIFARVNPGAFTGMYSLDATKDGQVKIPAGKALWYMTTSNDGAAIRSALFTVL